MRLTKHHGLGNDFLVLLDPDGSRPVGPDDARALCDRRRGVGADGLIRATPAGDAVASMELFNADGTPAEMSGNGIRCLAQALLQARWVDGRRVPIRTAAGLRTVTVHEQPDTSTVVCSVELGRADVGEEAPEWAGGPIRRAVHVDVGNPHLVFELADQQRAAAFGDTDAVDLVALGEQVNAKVPGGTNVHLLAPAAAGGIAIRSYERGVGPTEACGTGACASAAAAAAWGLAGEHVRVRMPGGEAEVTLGPPVVLRGPAVAVAVVEVPVPAGVVS